MFREGISILFYLVGILTLIDASGDHDISKREIQTGNMTSYDSVYGYNEYKILNPTKEPTLCYDSIGVYVNGTVFMNFTCPLPDQDKGLTDCCNNTCCRPKVVKKRRRGDSAVIVAVVLIVVCAVVVTLCAVLYYCCLQRRPGIREGKLVWIKRKKKKNVSEEGGVSSETGNAADDNEVEEVLAVVYSPEENGHLGLSPETPLYRASSERRVFVLPEEVKENIEMDKHEGSCPRSHKGDSWLS